MRFEYFMDNIRQWRWRLRAANGRILADSGESYWNQHDCLQAIQLVKGNGPFAPVVQVIA